MLKAAAQRSRHISPGDKLGKYEVIRQIAVGGMAELYLARTSGIEGFEKLVVVKRILPQYVANASFVNMFLNEARLAATLHHPNVAQVYDIGLEQGDYFFSMEYVHGEDLDHMAMAADEQGVPISLDAALTLVAGLCAGLHHAHDKASPDGKPLQIVHRDVSPSNVLVSYDGAVKLVDFGIARATSRPGTTHGGGLKGKIAYMSPEQCRANAQLDRRSDVYAVGTILYQLTTGQLPFSGESEYQILNQIVNDDVPAPSSIVPGYPPALEQIVLRAVARDPANRFSTALELQTAVEDFAHESRLRISPLTLARLMGTLFPARLEEWDQAKAQGAFFVEQQVVQTLIESGRTPDRGEHTSRALRAAAAGDEETTINAQVASMQFLGDSTVNAQPISTTDLSQTDVRPLPDFEPPSMPAQQPAIPTTPPPGTYPAYTPGTLVSSSGVGPSLGIVEARAAHADVTEQVRVPRRRASSPTTLVRTASTRNRWVVIGGALVVVGAIAAFAATRNTSTATARPAASAAPAASPAAPAAPPSPATATPSSPPATTHASSSSTPPVVDEETAVTAESASAESAAPALASTDPAVPAGPAQRAEPATSAQSGASGASGASGTSGASGASGASGTPTGSSASARPGAEVAASAPARDRTVETPKRTKRDRKSARPRAKRAASTSKTKPPAETKSTWNADSPFMPVRTETR